MQADKPIPLTWLWVIEIVTFGIIEYKRYQNFKKVGEVSHSSMKNDQSVADKLTLLFHHQAFSPRPTCPARHWAACPARVRTHLQCVTVQVLVIDRMLQCGQACWTYRHALDEGVVQLDQTFVAQLNSEHGAHLT